MILAASLTIHIVFVIFMLSWPVMGPSLRMKIVNCKVQNYLHRFLMVVTDLPIMVHDPRASCCKDSINSPLLS
jgi:hypothetical protein